MKKLIAILAAMIMTVSLAAAETTDTTNTEEQLIGMANPWTELDSLEALNEAAETNLQLPGVMGVSDETYRLLKTESGTIAELDFQVNGTPYTFRASADMTDDISGVYLDSGKTAFEYVDFAESPAYVSTDTMKLARWADINAQYVLMVEDNGQMDEETFASITEEMMDLTNPFQPIVLLEGTYQDSTSQRAYAIVTSAGDNTYAIEIHWADSAFEDNVWMMTAVMGEDGLMSYNDCVEKHVTTAEDGSVTEAEADIIPEGFFTPLSETSFDWYGAADESCRNCVFVLELEQ